MPHPLQIELIEYQQKLQNAQRSFQISGLYTIASPESQIYRHERGHPKSYKIGKSWDICKRLSDYLLAFPFTNPGMDVHLLLLMPHAITREEKSNVDRAESFVLARLHEKFPSSRNWPGVLERFRLFQKRSEWFQGSLDTIEKKFKEAVAANKFGPMLLVKNSRHVDIPKLWTDFKAEVQSDKKEKRDRQQAELEKDQSLQESLAKKKKRGDKIYESDFPHRPVSPTKTRMVIPHLAKHAFEKKGGTGYACDGCNKGLANAFYCGKCYNLSGNTFCLVCHNKTQS